MYSEKNTSQKNNIIGLTEKQANERLEKFGANQLAKEKKRKPAKIFAEQFKNIMVIILLVSTVISVALGEIYDAITIILIVLLNSILGFIQEYRTERTLEALKNMTAPTARVYRNGSLCEIPATEIVVGDVFELEAGDKVPCDGMIISSKGLFADEAILTGEAVPVEKFFKSDSTKYDSLNLDNITYMGTVITKGVAKCEAVSTGMDTQMGKVSGMLGDIEDEQTPLQKKLAELGRIVAIICVAICLIVFAAGVIRGEPIFDMLMTGITIAIAAIPEGLPATVTIVLALAVGRMLKKKALVHKLHSVETLGCASVICSDKTGTITENKMTVTKIASYEKEYDVTGQGYKIAGDILLQKSKATLTENSPIQNILKCSVLCNNASISKLNTKGVRTLQMSIARGEWVTIGDPTEIAMLVASAKGGITNLNRQYERIDEIPFDSETKCMKVVVKNSEDEKLFLAKGAVDVILSQCEYVMTERGEIELTPHIRKTIMRKNDELANQALRVLGFAGRNIYKYDNQKNANSLTFYGMMGMLDPPRAEAKKAIKLCEKANIKTVMITGDHKVTACAIATQAGIMKPNSIALTGAELDKMSDNQLDEVIQSVAVFARVNPSDKLRIVRAFKRKGEIVAMTGDGVNDAPAIKEADIGVSMGITGTDVTKQAADVILMDDNFATLVSAVEQGRTIYSNIRKFVRYLLSCNIGEVMTMFLGIIMGMPMVLLPTQILLVNLVTDGLPAVALGLEPPEDNTMRKKPRKSSEGFFSDGLMTKIVFRGIFIGLGTLATFVALNKMGGDINTCRTGALFTLVMSQLIHVFECKSEEKGLFSVKYLSNPFLVLSVIISVAVLIACMILPSLQIVFSTVALSTKQLSVAFGFALAVPFLSSISNLFKKKK